ncbi:MAG: RecX family transcriptional regulator [Anaerolineae bacterium]|nr:RecX family transcriptional regulator [Anaerolineae bacterium]
MPGKITALETQKRAKRRLNVYLDGEFAFGLAEIIAANLCVGDWFTDEEISALKAEDEVERAREKVLNFLSYRPRSEAELRQYLSEREFSEMAIDELISRLSRVGLVDDAAFARFWVEDRAQFRPRGKWILAQELHQKGIAQHDIDAALASYQEYTAAERVAQEQARRLAHLPPKVFRRRFIERLSRRGFPYELIQELLATDTFSHLNLEESEEDEI